MCQEGRQRACNAHPVLTLTHTTPWALLGHPLVRSCSSKSTVAAAAAQRLNPAFKVTPLQNRVSPETENVFNDKFWQVCVGGWVGPAFHLVPSSFRLDFK